MCQNQTCAIDETHNLRYRVVAADFESLQTSMANGVTGISLICCKAIRILSSSAVNNSNKNNVFFPVPSPFGAQGQLHETK